VREWLGNRKPARFADRGSSPARRSLGGGGWSRSQGCVRSAAGQRTRGPEGVVGVREWSGNRKPARFADRGSSPARRSLGGGGWSRSQACVRFAAGREDPRSERVSWRAVRPACRAVARAKAGLGLRHGSVHPRVAAGGRSAPSGRSWTLSVPPSRATVLPAHPGGDSPSTSRCTGHGFGLLRKGLCSKNLG